MNRSAYSGSVLERVAPQVSPSDRDSVGHYGGIPGVAEKIERLRRIDPEFDDYMASGDTVRVFTNDDSRSFTGKILLSHIDEGASGREAAIVLVDKGNDAKTALVFVRRKVCHQGIQWAIPDDPLSPGLATWSEEAIASLTGPELSNIMTVLYQYRDPILKS